MSTRFRPERALAVPFSVVAQIAACCFIALLTAVPSLLAADRPDAPTVVEEIVAKVNGDIITRGDLAASKVLMEKEAKAQGLSGMALQQALQRGAADDLRNKIDEFLLVQKGKELDINVDADLNKFIAGVQSDSKIADPDKFHDWVRQIIGMSYEDFRQRKKNELITSRVVDEEVWRNINIPEADMLKYYNEHKADFIRKESVTLREILVSTGDGKPETVAAARKKADALLARARSGSDKFSDLARQNSDAPSAEDEGLLPPFEKGKLSKPIEDVVFSHEKGYITDIIRIPAGFEFLKIEDHVAEGQATFDDVKAQINNILIRPIADPKLREYLTGLRQNAFLQIKPGYIDTGAAPGKDTTWKDPSQLLPETTTKAQVANQRHLKKLLGIIPYGYAGEPDTTSATPAATPVRQTPVTTPDGNAAR